MSTPITTKSRSIASRLRSFGVVDAAIDTHAAEAADILNRRYGLPDPGTVSVSQVEDQPVSDYRDFFDNLGTELDTARLGMVSANSTHLSELARILRLQKRRDELKTRLLSVFLKARNGLTGLFGAEEGFSILAVAGDTPRDPVGLVLQVRETVEFLRQSRTGLPPLEVAGVEIDPQVLATQLATGAEALDDALAELERAVKDAQTTREAKNAAIDEFDRVSLWVGRALESLFHLAGMHELAERVRPSTRRPGRRAADEESESDSDEPAAGETATEASVAEPVTDVASEAS